MIAGSGVVNDGAEADTEAVGLCTVDEVGGGGSVGGGVVEVVAAFLELRAEAEGADAKDGIDTGFHTQDAGFKKGAAGRGGVEFIHEGADAAHDHFANAGVGMEGVVEDVPLVGVGIFMCGISPERVLGEGGGGLAHAPGEVLVPGEKIPFAGAFGIAVDVEILPGVIGVLHDDGGGHVVDDLRDVHVVEEENVAPVLIRGGVVEGAGVFDVGGGEGLLEPGDEGCEVTHAFIGARLFFYSGGGVIEDGAEVVALDEFVEGSVFGEVVSFDKILIDLLDEEGEAVEGFVEAELDGEGI